jgi:uncharacterized protein (TIRG00374 family)
LYKMKHKLILSFAGFTIGAGFMVLAFSQIAWGEFLTALVSIKPSWLALTVGALLLSMFLRSIRWRLVCGLPQADQPKVWEAACVGYLGAVIYPARAGDVLRMLRLHQLTGMGGGVAIGGAMIDRILEGLGLCCMLLVLLLGWGVDLEARQGLFALAYIFLAAAGGAAVFVVSGHRLRWLFKHIAGLGKVGRSIERWYGECLAGLQILRLPNKILLVFLYQGVVSLLDLLACWFLLHAFGWNLPILTSMVVLVYITAAALLPSTPGFIGVYQVATLYALRPSGIDSSSAVAYGTVLQVLTLILFSSVGIWAIWKQKARNRCTPS